MGPWGIHEMWALLKLLLGGMSAWVSSYKKPRKGCGLPLSCLGKAMMGVCFLLLQLCQATG